MRVLQQSNLQMLTAEVGSWQKQETREGFGGRGRGADGAR